MENCSVIEAVFGFLARRGMRPLALAFGEFHKVGYGLGRIFFEETADDVAFSGFKRCVESGLAGHGFLSGSSLVVNRCSFVQALSRSRGARPHELVCLS